MPVSVRSRYWNQRTVEVPGHDGPRFSLPIRRPLVPPEGITVPHVVNASDGIESVAAHYYGRSDVWWRIADVNPLRFPLSLDRGEKLQIPERTGIGRVVRTRGG